MENGHYRDKEAEKMEEENLGQSISEQSEYNMITEADNVEITRTELIKADDDGELLEYYDDSTDNWKEDLISEYEVDAHVDILMLLWYEEGVQKVAGFNTRN